MQLWTPSSARVYTLLMAPNCFPSGWGKLNSIANGFKVCFLNSRSPSTLSRTGSPICLLLLATLSIEYYACPVPNFGLLRSVPIIFFFFFFSLVKGGCPSPMTCGAYPPTNLDYKYNLVWVLWAQLIKPLIVPWGTWIQIPPTPKSIGLAWW